MDVRIGTSGWSYDHWAGVLYRPGLPAARRLDRYTEVFDTVELNASFYRWPRETTFCGWRDRLPQGFTLSIKAHRGLSHYRRLANAEPWVERIEAGSPSSASRLSTSNSGQGLGRPRRVESAAATLAESGRGTHPRQSTCGPSSQRYDHLNLGRDLTRDLSHVV